MKKIILLMLIPLFLSVCASAKTLPTRPDTCADQVLNRYFDIRNALLADDGKQAQIRANDLLLTLNKVSLGSLSPEKKALWKRYDEQLRDNAKQIAANTDLSHQREFFALLSKDLFVAIKTLKLNRTVIFEQYCPMKQAIWLSESGQVKNPYLGQQMSDCGMVKEQLDAAPDQQITDK